MLLHLDSLGQILRHEDHWSVADALEGSACSDAYWFCRRGAGWAGGALRRLLAPCCVLRGAGPGPARAPSLSVETIARQGSDKTRTQARKEAAAARAAAAKGKAPPTPPPAATASRRLKRRSREE